MSLGLFDVVGPVMHGPSSSHTAGANRIGYLAGQIMGGVPKALEFGFHPGNFQSLMGQRSHVALAAGCLGWREDDPRSAGALEVAAEYGIEIETYPIDRGASHRNTMRVHGSWGGINWEINGISLGGGNVLINSINGVEVSLDGNNWGVICIFDSQESMEECGRLLSKEAGKELKAACCGRTYGGGYLYCGAFLVQPMMVLSPELDMHLVLSRVIPPLVKFRKKNGKGAIFNTFDHFLAAGTPAIDEEAIRYECRRTGLPREAVLAEADRIAEISSQGIKQCLEEPPKLLGGLCLNTDGAALAAYAASGNTLAGETFNLALARAVLLAEANASMGLVVAAPTGGAAGTLPAVLLTVAESREKSREELARAFLVAAAIGVVIGNKASFSGDIGGCQSSIGIGAAMAAGAAAWLGGADNAAVVHAAALALKNVLGLTCDLPADTVEVPCIKRNAMGASVALMAAEMALAGVRSAVDPDSVVDALVDTQRRMPPELKGSCGGLASTAGGARLRQKWLDKLKSSE